MRRLSVLLFAIFAIMLGTTMVSRSQAQSLPLLTRHVRQETLNGQAPLVGICRQRSPCALLLFCRTAIRPL